MCGMRPQPQVGEDFLDDLALVNKRDDAHSSDRSVEDLRWSNGCEGAVGAFSYRTGHSYRSTGSKVTGGNPDLLDCRRTIG